MSRKVQKVCKHNTVWLNTSRFLQTILLAETHLGETCIEVSVYHKSWVIPIYPTTLQGTIRRKEHVMSLHIGLGHGPHSFVSDLTRKTIQQMVCNLHTVASKYEPIQLLFVGDTQIQSLCEKCTFFAITDIKCLQRTCQHFKTSSTVYQKAFLDYARPA